MPKHPPQSLLAFDFGEKHIGVAYGQAITQTARPLKNLKANNGQPIWQEVEKLIKEWQPEALVVGYPLNMDGTEQPLTLKAEAFCQALETRFQLPLYKMDERLSTVEAKSELFEKGGYRALTKANIDNLSAVLILESWFRTESVS